MFDIHTVQLFVRVYLKQRIKMVKYNIRTNKSVEIRITVVIEFSWCYSFIKRDRRFCNVWFNSHEILYLIELMKKLFGLNLDFSLYTYCTYIICLWRRVLCNLVINWGNKWECHPAVMTDIYQQLWSTGSDTSSLICCHGGEGDLIYFSN